MYKNNKKCKINAFYSFEIILENLKLKKALTLRGKIGYNAILHKDVFSAEEILRLKRILKHGGNKNVKNLSA